MSEYEEGELERLLGEVNLIKQYIRKSFYEFCINHYDYYVLSNDNITDKMSYLIIKQEFVR